MPKPRRSALGTLLGTLPPARFLERYWTQQPLVVRGAPARLPSLFRARALQSLDGVLGTNPSRVRAWFTDERGAAQSVELSADAARTLDLDRRLTIVVDTIRVPAVDALMESMKRELHTLSSAFGANAYVSPAGAGTRMHFDEQDVFLAQIRGKKRWRFAAQAQLKHPTEPHFGAKLGAENALSRPKFPERMPRGARTVVLSPGDVLYLPAGTWHEAETLKDSVGLTLTFPTSSWLDLLMLRLRERLVTREAWRARTVGILAPPSPLQARALATFGALVKELGSELSELEVWELLTK